MNQQQLKPITLPLTPAAWLLAATLGLANAAWAQLTDIAPVPLTSSAQTLVKPNVMFILDDSGSMNLDHMPDDANFVASKYGRNASQCNGLAYNPGTTYALPITSTGTNHPPGTFTFPTTTGLSSILAITSPASPSIATGSITVTVSGTTTYAVNDTVTIYSGTTTGLRMVGVVTSLTGTTITVNATLATGSGSLSSPRIARGDNLPFYYTYSGSQTRLGYTYNSSGVITSTTFYQQCNSDLATAPGSGVFTRVTVTPTFAQLQNYRNWYTYYRTRSLTMRSAASLAFGTIGDRFRVGFSTISSRIVSGSGFLDVADFTAAHKALFYTELFGANPSGWTPLRGALSKAGKYFAKRATRTSVGAAQTYDPMQYSCQRNFAILTTDGYWNTNAEVIGSGTDSYGPDRLDNTDVGQQDGGATPRPMHDGAATTTQERTSQLESQTVTPQWTTATSRLQFRSVSGSWQTSTSNLQARTQALETRTSFDSGATWSAWSTTGSCTWDTSGGSRRDCRYNPTWSGWANTGSCTAVNSTGTSNGTTWTGNRTECQYTAWTPYTNTPSCTAQAQDLTSPHTVGTATQCLSPVYGAWTNATATCTATATNECQYTAPVNTTTTSCTAVAQSPASPYTVLTATQCTAQASLLGPWTNAGTCTASATSNCRYNPTAWSAWSLVSACTAAPKSVAPNYTVGLARECQTTSSGGTSDTLADVAMYYYETDLRTTTLGNCASTLDGTPTGIPTNVCLNNVSPSGIDNVPHQHMTTYTLGMGVGGLLTYRSDYLTAASGSYYNILQGTAQWPAAGPSAAAENIDDLWHAAVNGRGRYFSAGDPSTLAESLSSTLQSIDIRTGSGSGAAASTLRPVAGDNAVFIAKYQTVNWVGDLIALSIDPITGATTGQTWSAAQVLQARVGAGTARDIRYFQRTAGANTGALQPFTYVNLAADGLAANVDGACSKTPALTQCGTLNVADTAIANLGANMVSFLRGGANSVYRTRSTGDAAIPGGILGDVIGGAPLFVGQPAFSYVENDYAGFVAAQLATNPSPPVTVPPTLPGRRRVVYVAANDGMLHAFDARTGAELWAYVPTAVMNRMYRLADRDYANRHEFFVNGAPVMGDIFVPGSPGRWKTILVGGLGAGGRGYYALDITDPMNPISLWEFGNDTVGGNGNLGLTFGNPVITKRANGTWVVAFSSGYNNVSPGDGNGRLFVVNANTGQNILNVPTYTTGTTPAGTATAPSGLGKINVWVDSETDNSARRFYGGDLFGNLWRFDIDNLVAPNGAALRLGYFSNAGVPQPITTKPLLGEVNYSGTRVPVVYVGTGKYLGTTDLASTSTQTVYALKDPLTNTSLGDVRANTSVVTQTASEAGPNLPRAITNLPVNWATGNGWRVDLLSPGERVNVDMRLLFNTLTLAGNIPSNDVCVVGGSSYAYQLDIGTGGGTGRWLGGTMVVGISWFTLASATGEAGGGATVTEFVNERSERELIQVPPSAAPTTTGRRTSWRELVN